MRRLSATASRPKPRQGWKLWKQALQTRAPSTGRLRSRFLRWLLCAASIDRKDVGMTAGSWSNMHRVNCTTSSCCLLWNRFTSSAVIFRSIAILVIGCLCVYVHEVDDALERAWQTLRANSWFQHESFEVSAFTARFGCLCYCPQRAKTLEARKMIKSSICRRTFRASRS